jgi:glutathionylspermidine synthase
VWYRYSRFNLRQRIAQKIEDILKMREYNAKTPHGLSEARQKYIDQANKLNPNDNSEE